MFRLRIRGPPRAVLELLGEARGVEAEAFLSVGDPQTLLALVQRAVSRGLAVEILPAAPVEQRGARAAEAPQRVSERRAGEAEPERRSAPEAGSGEGVGGAASPVGEEEMSFDELMRLKQEALSRRLVEE